MGLPTRAWIYAIVLLLFIVLHLAGMGEVFKYLSPQVAHWAERLEPFATVLVAGLLGYMVLRSEGEREHSEHERALLIDARTALAEAIKSLTTLRTEVIETKESVKTPRQQFRSADIALHGKILFYEEKYDEADEV